MLNLIDQRFNVMKTIGAGSYGQVLQVHDTFQNKEVAMKLVPKIDINGYPDETFNAEVSALQQLSGLDGVPEFFAEGDLVTHRYMVVTLLTEDLDCLRIRNADLSFNPGTVLQILWHAIRTLETIHDHGYLHMDIKASNWMIKVQNENVKVFLVDFGLSRRFRDERGDRLPFENNGINFFSCLYSAPRAAQGRPYLETEDLIATCYMAFMLRNQIPWEAETFDEMLQKKIEFGTHPELYVRTEEIFLFPFVQIVMKQIYGRRPNYEKILSVIEMVVQNINASPRLEVQQIDGLLRLL